jgi:multidrug efflux pump subunit AcrB
MSRKSVHIYKLQVYVQADSKYRVQTDDLLKLFVRSQDGNITAERRREP